MSKQITITLNQIRKYSPCISGWSKVLKANGGSNADFNKPFPVSSILDSNDLDDTLWTLQCLPRFEHLWRDFAKWCALQNIEKIKPYCSNEDYQLILSYLNNDNSAAESAAWSAARSAAARSAAWSAARPAAARSAAESAAQSAAARSAQSAAARSAARSAAWSAAESAAQSAAAWSAAESAAARSAAWSAADSAQIDTLREILDSDEWVE